MSLAKDENLSGIEEAIEQADLLGKPAILTGYLLISEWAAGDSEEVYIVESAPESQPYWKTLGFVEACRLSIAARTQVEGEE